MNSNSFYFLLDVTTDRNVSTHQIANTAQLETMSAISHPWRGLPKLVDFEDFSAFKSTLDDSVREGIPEAVFETAMEGALPSWRLRFEKALGKTLSQYFGWAYSKNRKTTDRDGAEAEMKTAATTIALAAIRSVDLITSLDMIASTSANQYPYVSWAQFHLVSLG